MSPEQVEAKLDRLEGLGVDVQTIGESREGRPMRALRIGSGPTKVAAIAGAHPDEPVGTVTCLHLAERLATDERLAPLLDRITLHLVPQANPDGAERNRGWVEAWAEGPDLGAYLEGVRRDPPKADVEFGFPQSPGGDARPENRAIAGWFDGIGALDHYVSLHSMFLGGGALFLASTDEMSEAAPRLRFMLEQVDGHGLPLHDKDRFGQKGFHRICAGLQTAPTAEEMRAFFAGRPEAEDFKLNSMQYVRRHNGCPLALVSEIPLTYDASLASMKPAGHSRAEEERRLAAVLLEVCDQGDAWAGALREVLGQDDPEVARFGASVASLRSGAEAMRGDLERYGDAPATEGNVRETRLNELRRRATFAATALGVLEGRSEPGAERLRTSLRDALDGALAGIEADFQLKHPPLQTQVSLQIAAVLAGLVERPKGSRPTE